MTAILLTKTSQLGTEVMTEVSCRRREPDIDNDDFDADDLEELDFDEEENDLLGEDEEFGEDDED